MKKFFKRASAVALCVGMMSTMVYGEGLFDETTNKFSRVNDNVNKESEIGRKSTLSYKVLKHNKPVFDKALKGKKRTPYAIHGRLKVKGRYLVDKKGKKFQIKGISTHGINWDVGKPYVNKGAFKFLRDKMGANCVRVAMYTEDYNGYCITDENSRKDLLNTINKAVKYTKSLGMYCIIDWHILNDKTPKKYQKQAKAFFKKMAKKYKKKGNVLFEICNEPNGGTSWSEVRTYANSIIKTIRKVNKKVIIIVGTPNWSQDVDIAANSPVKKKKNVMYTVHFYAATHGQSYRDKVQAAINKGLPVFCTEFSCCESSGDGYINTSEGDAWISFLNKNKISYVCWSLSNKAESASLLNSGCQKKSGFSDGDLSTMGNWIKSKYR